MSETYFHKLNLPEVPLPTLKWVDEFEWTDSGYFIWKWPQYNLSKELLTMFKDRGLNPGYMVLFCSSESLPLEKRMIHTDLVTLQDPRTVKELSADTKWRRPSFGINFEVYGGTNEFHWYKEPENVKEVYPPANAPDWSAWLQGIHYGTRWASGVQSGFEEQAHTTIGARPVMVRADVPHSTGFTMGPGQTRRIGVSIRFFEPWTWAEAEQKFSQWFE